MPNEFKSETDGLQEADLFNAGENYKEDDDKFDCERNEDIPLSTPDYIFDLCGKP